MQAFNRKLCVLGLGGTIAGRSLARGDNVGYQTGEVDVDALLPPGFSELPCLAGVQIETRQLAQIDSKDMTHALWFDVASAVLAACADDAVAGVVITHGTDTVEETAFFLAQLCAPCKPVVLTCAMRPATAVSPDGPQNLVDAACVAMDTRASGVWVVAAGAVHTPTRVAKVHPYRVDAFSSGETGPAAVVEEGRVRWLHGAAPHAVPSAVPGLAGQAAAPLCGAGAQALLASVVARGLPRVEWVVSHAGVTPAAVTAWLRDADAGSRVRGLVLVGTGNGTFHHCLSAPLRTAEAAGVWVWRSTRCTEGQMVLGSSSVNWPRAVSLDPVKARIALSLAIAAHDVATSSDA